MLSFTRLKANLKKSTAGFKTVRLAVLCDYASQHLTLALKGVGVDRRLAVEVCEADYDQIEQQVFDGASTLYGFSPEFVLLSKSTYKLLDAFYATPVGERSLFASKMASRLQAIVQAVRQRSKATVVLTNFLELNDAVFGHYANNVSLSFLYQVRKLNLLLMEEAQVQKGLLIADAQVLASEVGVKEAVDLKTLIKADLAWSIEFLPALAKAVVGLIESAKGGIKKCIVLDLDNTLWGGVIGDDGIEGIELGELGMGRAYSRFQKWVKELKGRGVIVCICSKNNEAVAKEVFQSHPDTVLTLDDIAVFAANWNNKVDNLHFIKNTLNIAFDAMVFIDDNPFERGMLREALPELEVPEMPEDPVDYLPYLQRLNLFETTSYTAEDEERTNLYRQEAQRLTYQKVYKNEDDYLAELHMKAEINLLNGFTIPRAAQLSQRSNQFNLRTVRYTEADLQSLAVLPDYFSFVVSLSDKFGSYGLISFVVLKKEGETLFIESWMMSCRVLKRGVEAFVLNQIASIAQQAHCSVVTGEYLATAKNALVKDHYKDLGFNEKSGLWVLDVSDFKERTTAVRVSDNQKNYHPISE